jgi:arsenate reductase
VKCGTTQKRAAIIVKPSQPLVLFVGRRNSGPSIMAEAMLRHLGRKRVQAASAGTACIDPVNPHALGCLRAHGIATTGLHAKTWSDFFGPGKPPVRFLILLSNTYAAKAGWPAETLIADVLRGALTMLH